MLVVFKSPAELNTDFHLGMVKEYDIILSIDKWDMAYSNEILMSKTS